MNVAVGNDDDVDKVPFGHHALKSSLRHHDWSNVHLKRIARETVWTRTTTWFVETSNLVSPTYMPSLCQVWMTTQAIRIAVYRAQRLAAKRLFPSNHDEPISSSTLGSQCRVSSSSDHVSYNCHLYLIPTAPTTCDNKSTKSCSCKKAGRAEVNRFYN